MRGYRQQALMTPESTKPERWPWHATPDGQTAPHAPVSRSTVVNRVDHLGDDPIEIRLRVLESIGNAAHADKWIMD